MNVTLGSGKAVHANHVNTVNGEITNKPECGGNRASERFYPTAAEVTCKKCLKWIAAQPVEAAEVAPVEAAEVAPVEAAEVAPVEDRYTTADVQVDMVTKDRGLVGVAGTTVSGEVLAIGYGLWQAENRDGRTIPGRYTSAKAAALAVVRAAGVRGPLEVEVHHEY